MTIKSYLNLYELLALKNITREENRAFGLSQILLNNKPTEQILAWIDEHIEKLPRPRLSEKYANYMYGITLSVSVIAFILGLLSGLALLSYSGKEPVNVVYFMAMAVFLPLFTMTLTLISMFRANSAQSMLVHISPAYWMVKVLSFLPNSVQEDLKSLKINPLLANWVVIKRSQIIALCFSFGLLLALLGMIVTKDIAFAWSTTLDISPEAFHAFLHFMAYPWKDLVPSAVPSLELIEHSQYFRLGDKLSEEMIGNASMLGQWWKFLAMATLFYAIILRFLFYLLASVGLKRAIKKSLYALSGTERLLREMNEPIISTQASGTEEVFVPTQSDYAQIVNRLDTSYDVVQGWAIPKDQLVVLSDSYGVIAPKFYEVGGSNSLDEDNEIISKSHGEVLLFVKSWEPPTMDFVDYVKALSNKVDKVIIVPVGTADNHYRAKAAQVDIWDRKLSTIGEGKIWLKR